MGSWSIRLFRVFGIELEVHLTFLILWVFFAAEGWRHAGVVGILWASALLILIFTCVVLHELGHSLAARRYNIPVSRILLLPFGGMAQFEKIPRNPRQEIVISLAGPAVNLLLICAILPAMTPTGFTFQQRFDLMGVVQALFVVNVIMALFNLLPIFPMDGGRVLRALLATRLPYLKATGIAVGLAKVLAIAGIIGAVFLFPNPFLVFLFAFIFIGGDIEYRITKRREQMSGLYVRDLTRQHYLSIPAGSPMAEAESLFEAFRPGEILVMDGDVPLGYLTTRIVKDAVKNGRQHDPARAHCMKKFSVLQAGWPLDPFAEMITQSSQRLYPVYAFGDLIGVVDTKNLESLIAWHRLRETAEHRAHAKAARSPGRMQSE